MPKVLISDKMDPKAAQIFRERGVEVDEITGKTPEELKAIISTAKDYGMHVAAHAHGAEGMKRAVLAGVTTIEHGTKMTEEVMDLMNSGVRSTSRRSLPADL